MRWAAGLGVVVCAVLLAGCQQPYRVFAVQVAAAAPAIAPAEAPVAKQSARLRRPPRKGKAGVRAVIVARGRHVPWDLNRVPARLLRTLPGMDAATVQRIVAGRPYHAKRDLLKRGILTAAQYAQWKASLVVHRNSAFGAATFPK